MINARTKADIQNGIKFGRASGLKNKKTAEKLDKIRIFLRTGKSYDWIAKELSVSTKTIAEVKQHLRSMASSKDTNETKETNK